MRKRTQTQIKAFFRLLLTLIIGMSLGWSLYNYALITQDGNASFIKLVLDFTKAQGGLVAIFASITAVLTALKGIHDIFFKDSK